MEHSLFKCSPERLRPLPPYWHYFYTVWKMQMTPTLQLIYYQQGRLTINHLALNTRSYSQKSVIAQVMDLS